MESINVWLFLKINAGVDPSILAVTLARMLAEGSVPLGVLCIVGLWVWGAPERRRALLGAVMSWALAMSVNLAISLLWFHPRPFMIGLGHQLLAHGPETSFPSDHATFLLSLGLGLLLAGGRRRWGALLVALGAGVAWSRVYLGVHFPFDMAGSLVVALASAAVVRLILQRAAVEILPRLEHLYAIGLMLLHLPPDLFPRDEGWRGSYGGSRG